MTRKNTIAADTALEAETGRENAPVEFCHPEPLLTKDLRRLIYLLALNWLFNKGLAGKATTLNGRTKRFREVLRQKRLRMTEF